MYVIIDRNEARYQVKEQNKRVIKQDKFTKDSKNMPLDSRLQAVRTAAFKRLKSPYGKRYKRYNIYIHIRDPELAKKLRKNKELSILK